MIIENSLEQPREWCMHKEHDMTTVHMNTLKFYYTLVMNNDFFAYGNDRKCTLEWYLARRSHAATWLPLHYYNIDYY